MRKLIKRARKTLVDATELQPIQYSPSPEQRSISGIVFSIDQPAGPCLRASNLNPSAPHRSDRIVARRRLLAKSQWRCSQTTRSHRCGNHFLDPIFRPAEYVSQRAGFGGSDEEPLRREGQCSHGRQSGVHAQLCAMPWEKPGGHGPCTRARHRADPSGQAGRAVLVHHQRQTQLRYAGMGQSAQDTAMGDRNVSAIQTSAGKLKHFEAGAQRHR